MATARSSAQSPSAAADGPPRPTPPPGTPAAAAANCLFLFDPPSPFCISTLPASASCTPVRHCSQLILILPPYNFILIHQPTTLTLATCSTTDYNILPPFTSSILQICDLIDLPFPSLALCCSHLTRSPFTASVTNTLTLTLVPCFQHLQPI